MVKQKYYVVWKGRTPGIYTSWAECQDQVNGFEQARYKSFESNELAEKAYKAGWQKHWGQAGSNSSTFSSHASRKGRAKASQTGTEAKQARLFNSNDEIDYNSISVDVGTKGNPGPIEYKGVDTKTGEVLFYVGPIENGTNNLGEFIAIVHALAYLKQQGSNKTIYTDSKTALKWIGQKQVNTTLKRNASSQKVWELTDRALDWLNKNTYQNKILKWDTEHWGEIKADFGRK